MKLIVPALLAVFLAAGCEKATDAAASMKEAGSSLDLGKLTPEAMKAEGTKLVSQIGTKLGEIKDEASAESITKQVEPLLASLGGLKDKLGLQNMDMSSIQSAITSLTSKFGSDTKVMGVIQPLIDKLQAMMK